jgi:hypothetical protein
VFLDGSNAIASFLLSTRGQHLGLGRNEKKKQVHSTPLKYALLRMTVFWKVKATLSVVKICAEAAWLLSYYRAIFHHEAYMLDRGDVVEGIAGDGDDVGEVSGF